VQAIIAAEVGHLDVAYDYLAESAFLDLDDTEHNTRDGLHIASLAGIWRGLSPATGGCAMTRSDWRSRHVYLAD
jgi:alpha,alpha-trehalose phosphorylase